MKGFQVKGKETKELKQLYNNLQQYWDTLMQSKAPGKFSSPLDRDTIKPIMELQSNSPRYLMSMLQQDQEECTMMMSSNEISALEIARNRSEAIKSGKFKGRRLFDSDDESPPCEEVMSVNSFYSDNTYESSGSKELEEHHCTSACRYSASSDVLDKMVKTVEEDMDNVAKTEIVGIRRYAVLFGALAFAFMLIAIFMSGGCCDDHEVFLVPT